jgi:hypothetical protein
LHEKCFETWFGIKSTKDFENLALKQASQDVLHSNISKMNTSFFHGAFKKYSAEIEGEQYILKVSQSEYPELPVTKRIHKSDHLFSSFADRIPSKKNPAYIKYCEKFGIPFKKEDEIILLSTIGKRDPSSFIFEQETAEDYTNYDYIAKRFCNNF